MAEKSEAAFDALIGGAVPDKSSLEQPNGPFEIERLVKTRRLQTFFRNAVLSGYENCCALTGISVPQILVASHITPRSESEGRCADPTNGLCLNVLHDKAFDRHLITFDENYRLIVSSLLKKGSIPEFQLANFTKLEGTIIKLSHRFVPDQYTLEEHRKAFITLQDKKVFCPLQPG